MPGASTYNVLDVALAPGVKPPSMSPAPSTPPRRAESCKASPAGGEPGQADSPGGDKSSPPTLSRRCRPPSARAQKGFRENRWLHAGIIRWTAPCLPREDIGRHNAVIGWASSVIECLAPGGWSAGVVRVDPKGADGWDSALAAVIRAVVAGGFLLADAPAGGSAGTRTPTPSGPNHLTGLFRRRTHVAGSACAACGVASSRDPESRYVTETMMTRTRCRDPAQLGLWTGPRLGITAACGIGDAIRGR